MQLAVADHDVGVERLTLDAGPERHPDADGEAVAEAAGAHLDAGDLDVRVHPEGGAAIVHGVEAVDVVVVDEAGQLERGAEAGVGVALGEDEAVAVRPVRLVGADVHLVEVEDGQDVGGGQRAAGVAAA